MAMSDARGQKVARAYPVAQSLYLAFRDSLEVDSATILSARAFTDLTQARFTCLH